MIVHLRTDPRDPANPAHTPGRLVALHNGLRDISHAIAQHGPGGPARAAGGCQRVPEVASSALPSDRRSCAPS
jgi:hypothetical protein